MGLDLGPLSDIARQHHATGEYGGALLVVAEDVLEAMRERHAAPPKPAMTIPDLAALLRSSIPLLVDAELPAGAWRLIDRTSKDVIAEGSCGPDLSAVGGAEGHPEKIAKGRPPLMNITGKPRRPS